MMTAPILVLLALCIAMEAARELCFRRAAEGVSLGAALQNPLTWAGILCWLIEIVAWIRVLQQLPLSIAYPLAALVYALVAIGGVVILKEPLIRRHMLGAMLVTVGVACVGSAGV